MLSKLDSIASDVRQANNSVNSLAGRVRDLERSGINRGAGGGARNPGGRTCDVCSSTMHLKRDCTHQGGGAYIPPDTPPAGTSDS